MLRYAIAQPSSTIPLSVICPGQSRSAPEKQRVAPTSPRWSLLNESPRAPYRPFLQAPLKGHAANLLKLADHAADFRLLAYTGLGSSRAFSHLNESSGIPKSAVL